MLPEIVIAFQLAVAAGTPDSLVAPAGPEAAARALRVDGGPRLDGLLDDGAWRAAVPITGFIQAEPEEGRPASERTEARVVFTADALYVGIRAWDRNAAAIAAPLTRRDEDAAADWLGVIIDSYHDRRTAFEFAVSAASVQRDLYRFADVEQDPSWDATWESAVARDAEGWTAEFRIPFSQLRFAGPPERIGFNLYRRIRRRNETQWWRPVPRDRTAVVSRFGELEGLETLRLPGRLEVRPYMLGRQRLEPAAPGNPFTGAAAGGAAGADLKLGLGVFTLSAAVNPDFGQVEADPAQVNLGTSETFRSERRPFFTEASDLFRFGIGTSRGGADQLFYSRRIGREPQLEPDSDGAHVEEVAQTSILGAAKITGRTPSGWTVGLMAALTDEERAGVAAADGTRHAAVVEPGTGYLVARLARDFREGRTVVGLFGTGLLRGRPEAARELRRSAAVLGADLSHRFAADAFELRAWVAASRVTGTAEAITETQRSSVHYFQRPDDAGSTLNPSRTALAGAAALIGVDRLRGAWRYGATVTTRSPGFEVNDVGYQPSAGRTWDDTYVSRHWLRPGRLARSASVRATLFGARTWGGQEINRGLSVESEATLFNYWTVKAGVWNRRGGLDPTGLRGGPAIRRAGNFYTDVSVDTDARRPVRLGARVEYWKYYGDETEGLKAYGTIGWRPSGRLELTAAPRVERIVESQQFVTDGEPGGEPAWIVGRLDQTTAAMALRADLVFTPAVSLQLVAEPFVSSGRYGGFRRVADPHAPRSADRLIPVDPSRITRADGRLGFDLDGDGAAETTTDEPDFTTVSWNSNVVLRWDYRPSSSLFLVWRQEREAETLDGRFRLGAGLDELGRTPARDELLIKLTYWWAR